MPRGPKGEKRPADVIGNAVKVMRLAAPESAKGRYSPAECIGIRKNRIEGNPDMDHVSTSYS